MNFLAVDFERTGFESSQEPRIIEIGAVEVSPQGLTGRTFHTRVYTPGPMSSFGTKVHGLRAHDLVGAPTFDVAWAAFEEWAQGLPMVLHNAEGDLHHLKHDLSCYGLSLKERAYHCSQRLFALVLGRNMGLSTIANMLGHPRSSLHGALLDAQLLAACLLSVNVRCHPDRLVGLKPAGLQKLSPLGVSSSRKTKAGGSNRKDRLRQQRLETMLALEPNPVMEILWGNTPQQVVFVRYQGERTTAQVPDFPHETHLVILNSYHCRCEVRRKPTTLVSALDKTPDNPFGPSVVALIQGQVVYTS